MRIGVSRPPTPPDGIPDVDGALVAVAAEKLGFESVFYGEHPIRPVDQAGASVHAHGIPFFQDTLVMVARATALTSGIQVGGGVFLIPEHNAIAFAKQLASADHYSGGRVVVGAGVGWSRVECELLGGNYDRRWAQALETIRLMKLLWTEETVTFDGEFYNVPPIQLFPKPARSGGPPVLLGTAKSERNFRRIVEYADGWLPAFVDPRLIEESPAAVADGRALLDRLAGEVGRAPSGLEISVILRGPQVDGEIGGGYAEVVSSDLITRLEDAGADRVLVSLPTLRSEGDAQIALERLAERIL